VFVDPDRLPLRPLDELLPGVRAFCSTTQRQHEPHLLSPSVLAAAPNHPALWHCVRDIADSIARYRGVSDQTGPGFLSRVIRDHAYFRDIVPFHWTMFEQNEADARAFVFRDQSVDAKATSEASAA
jgi:hypothetical protein